VSHPVPRAVDLQIHSRKAAKLACLCSAVFVDCA
jgi:hypothetical protein